VNALLDTSVFIARESGRPLAALPEGAVTAVSVITVAELRVGVLTADDPTVRSTRLATLESANRHHLPLPADEPVVEQFARLVALLTPAGKNPRVMDTLIAATALAHGAVIVSRDDDFEGLPGVTVVKV